MDNLDCSAFDHGISSFEYRLLLYEKNLLTTYYSLYNIVFAIIRLRNDFPHRIYNA